MHPIVIRFGRLGDMVLLAPLLHRLHRGYGKRCLLLGTGPWSVPMYAGHPDVARTLQATNRHRPLALSPPRWQMVQALRRHRDAAVHVCEPEPRALAKIRRMLVLAGVDPTHCAFISDTPMRTDPHGNPGEHWSDYLLRACGEPPPACAGAWQPPAPPNDRSPRLYVRAADRRDRDAWLRARGWRGEPVWLVQPSNRRTVHHGRLRNASADAKAWPAASWIAALRALHALNSDARIVLCGAPHEAPALNALAADARLDRLDAVARDLPLRRLMALAESARGMLSVDTGPAHVAAALGCPLVVLFGEHSPAVWCPRTPTGSRVVALGGPPEHTRVADIGVDEVIAALASLPSRETAALRAT